MIEVKTYIKHGEEFVLFNEYNKEIIDPNYIEGAIQLKVNRSELLTKHMWDYVDQLWAYITEGIVEISKNNNFSVCFPDQPIEINFEIIENNCIRITIENDELISEIVRKDEFISAMKIAAYEFFTYMGNLVTENTKQYQLTIRELEKL